MKKLISVLVMLVVCISILCIGVTTASAEVLTDVPKVAASTYSYYSAPSSTSANFVGYLYVGTEVVTTEYDSKFSVFEYNGEEYYFLNSKFEDAVRYIVSDSVNMKKSPDESSDTVTKLFWSTPVTLLSYANSGYYYCEYKGNRGYVKASSVGYVVKMTTTTSSNLFEYASTNASVLSKYTSAKEVVVQYISDNWARIEYSGYTGFISSKNLKYSAVKVNGNVFDSPEDFHSNVVKATVSGQFYLMAINNSVGCAMIQNTDGEVYWVAASSVSSAKEYTKKYVAVNRKALYSEPANTSSHFDIGYMEEIMLGEAVTVLSTGSWVEVKYKDTIYYTWISSGEVSFADNKSSYNYVGDTKYVQEALDLAKEIALEWETVYKLSESTGRPDSSGRRQFDCSGFVSYVLDTVMQKYNPLYDISSSVSKMYYETDIIYNAGYTGEFKASNINLAQIKPGDVLFFDLEDDDGIPDHCGMYLGNNEYAHSTTSFETGVIIDLLSESVKATVVGVRRYIPETVTKANKTLSTIATGKLYAEKNTSSTVLYSFAENEKVTLYFTNNGSWAYVAINGQKGFVQTKHIGEINAPASPVISAKLSDGKPKISWTAVDGATKYWVYRSTSKDGTYTCIKTVTVNYFTDTSTSLVNGKTYYYKVKAVNVGGSSAYSTAVKAVPLGKATASAALSDGSPKISWKTVTGATKYAVYRSTAKDGTYTCIKTTTALSFTDTSTSLVKGKTYYYKVKAINANGYSAYSTAVKAVPLGKATASAALSDGNPKISWKTVTGATKYAVYRSTAKDGTYTCIKTTTALSFTDTSTSLVKGKTYYYKVKAINANGYSAYSTAVKAVPLAKPSITVKRTSSGDPKISWGTVKGATKYAVYRATSYNGTYKLIKTTENLYYTDTSSALSDGKNYYYKVKAVNANGYSAYSSYAKVLLLGKASISSSLSDGKPKISWKAVSGATKYSVYRATSKTGEYKCIATVTTLSYVDKSTALENGKTYYYKVRARSDGGYADYSSYTAVTPLAKPAVSSSLSKGSPKISWKAVSGATKYAVYRADSKDGTYKLIKTTTALSYTDTSTSLKNGKTYYYKVKAVNAKGYSAFSNTVYKKVTK